MKRVLCVGIFPFILLDIEEAFLILRSFLVFLYFLPSSRTCAVVSSSVG